MRKSRGNAITWVLFIIVLLLVAVVLYEVFHKSNQTPATSNSAATSTVVSQTPDTVPADWKTFVNSTFKYQFRYPQSITYTKAISLNAPDNNSSISYPANNPITVLVSDISKSNSAPAQSQISVSPLYVEVDTVLKPSGYTTLQNYVQKDVDTVTARGENSAAGVYASSSPTTVNGENGYLEVVSDGSVINNRDDKYYFDSGSYIYTFDMAYSGYYYETKDPDEVNRVDTAKAMLSSFRFIQ